MSNLANTQITQGAETSVDTPETQARRSWLQRTRDWLWGYDFFISYHWASGGPYAVNLAQRLRDARYDVFLDRAEYAMGDDWKKVGAHALSNTQRLILVATRDAVTDSIPVEREVQLFSSKNRQVIPIVFGDDLKDLDWSTTDVLSRMEESRLRIIEDFRNLAAGPSEETIHQLVRTHGLMRRRTLRRWIISVLIALISVSALLAGYQWQVAAEEARKANLQLAKNYMHQGIRQRDEKEDLLKASNFLFRAAAAGAKAGDNSISTNAQIAGKYLARYLPRQEGQFDHGKSVKGTILITDIQRLVTWGEGSVRLWDSRTGELLTAPIALETEIQGVRLSQDQQWLLTWGGGKARVWNSKTGQPVSGPITLPGCDIKANFSRDQRQVLTICRSGSRSSIQFWDSQTGTSLTERLIVKGHRFSKDLQRALVWGGDKAQVWNSHKGGSLSKMMQHEGEVRGARFSEDQERVLVWTGNKAHLWDTRTGDELCPPMEQPEIENGRLSQDKDRVLLWGGNIAQVWDTGTGKALSARMEHRKISDAWLSQNQHQDQVLTLGDGAIRFWSSRTGKALSTPMDKEEIVGVRFGEDPIRMLAWGGDIARVWANSTGIPLSPPMRHAEMKYARFSKDHEQILTVSARRVRLWDSYTGELLSDYKEHSGARFTEKQNRLLSLTGNTIRLLGIQTHEPPTVSIKHPNIQDVMFSQDQQRVFIKGWRWKFGPRVWDSRTGEPLSLPMSHDTEIHGVYVSPDWKRVLIRGEGTARVWDTQTGEPITPIMSYQNKAWSVKFSPDSQRVLIWGRHWARFWDTRTGNPISPVMEFKNMPYSSHVKDARFSPDNRQVLIWGPKWAQVWDSDKGELLDAPMNQVISESVWVLPGQEQVLSLDGHGNLQLWDGFTGMPLSAPIGNQMNRIDGIRLSPDQQRILVFGAETIGILDIHGEKLIPVELKHKIPIRGAQFSEESKRILIWSKNVARVLDSHTGKPLSKLMEQVGIDSAKFSLDNQQVLIWGGTQARVWDSYTGDPQSTPMVHEDGLKGVTLSHDNQRVLTWGGNLARVWDSSTGKNLTLPMVHDREIKGASFTEDQQRVLTWGQDDKLKIWNMETDLDFPKEHLLLRLEVKTGRKVNEMGDVNELIAEKWDERWADYEPIAKKHLKQCQYPRANWYLERLLHSPNSCEKLGVWLEDVNPAKLDEVKEMYAAVCG